jgi:hypothetical protein
VTSSSSASKTGVIAVIVISPLQFGQVSTFGTLKPPRLLLILMPFALIRSWASEQVHPGSGVCQSEKQELKTARSPCDRGSITGDPAPIIRRSRGKTTTQCHFFAEASHYRSGPVVTSGFRPRRDAGKQKVGQAFCPKCNVQKACERFARDLC